MKYIDIIYLKYLDDNGIKTIGGIQTYISDLCDVFKLMGFQIRIIQRALKEYKITISDNVIVWGVEINENNERKLYQKLYDKSVDTSESLVDTLTIFATDIIIPRKIKTKSIAIQHGVCWDIVKKNKRNTIRRILSNVRASEAIASRLGKVDKIVCVDYNFVNWYRTQMDRIDNEILVVPNYTKICQPVDKQEGTINIIFARRLFEYRGTRVFTKAIKRLLNEKWDIFVTVAGSGPDESWMKQQLAQYDNVEFIKYENSDSLEIHKDKHIAVIPTVGSEGTSLSLLEAMSAKCGVICTDVGGMTNIVLNGYNGLMVKSGDEKQLYEAIKSLICNPLERERIAETGYETVKHAFSYERWKKQWMDIVNGFENN